jgi:hypothetical protein
MIMWVLAGIHQGLILCNRDLKDYEPKAMTHAEKSSLSAMLRSMLDDAWQFRRAQDLPACMDLLSELKVELSLPYARQQREDVPASLRARLQLHTPEHMAFACETVILWASLLRAQKDLATAEDLLTVVEQSMDLVPSDERRGLLAKVAQEQGINAYVRGDFVNALEHFAVQGRLGATAVERSMGHVNGLLCYESLGLPTTSIHQRAVASIVEVQSQSVAAAKDLVTVVNDFEKRQAFGRGNMAPIFEGTPSDSRYSIYLRAWIGDLPWHLHHINAEGLTHLVNLMSPASGTLHLQDFRIRTLQGISLPEDPLHMPLSELAIRAYVWTWRWLLNPESFDVQRILDTLASPRILERPGSISPDHGHMLRNAAQWIGLFCAHHATRFERWSKAIPVSTGEDFSVFMWENLLIRFIEAKHHQRTSVMADIRAAAASIPKSPANGVLFGDLIAAQDDAHTVDQLKEKAPWLSRFLDYMTASNRNAAAQSPSGNSSSNAPHGSQHTGARSDHEKDPSINGAASSSQLSIDLLTHEIKKGPVTLMSRGMALGFAILKMKGQVSRADFVALVWGIRNYEPGIHDVKLLNLLARMRPLVSDSLRLGVKDHVVYAYGDWSTVVVNGSLAHVTDVNQAKVNLRSGASGAANSRDQNTLAETSAVRRAKAMLEVYVTETHSLSLTRRDIESILDLPRSSTNRMIERLTKYQILTPVGHGPKRRYEFKTTL